MANWIDSKMSAQNQEYAKQILKEYNLDNLTVTYIEKTNSLNFKQDRRTVSVPLSLLESGAWGDIRFLFRATLEAPNSLWNKSADENDWGGNNFYKAE